MPRVTLPVDQALSAAEAARDRLEVLRIGADQFELEAIDALIVHTTRVINRLDAMKGHDLGAQVVVELDEATARELELLAAQLDAQIIQNAVATASLDMVNELLTALGSVV